MPFSRKLAIFPLLAAAFAAVGAEPTLRISLDRDKIYLGESLVMEVTLQDAPENTQTPPTFKGGSPAEVSYRGPRSFSQSQITIVNGRRESKVNSSTIFNFLVTPSRAGTFETGVATLTVGGRTLRAPSASARVVAPEKLDFVKASLSCADKAVIVEGRFKVDVEIGLRALSGQYAGVEPVIPRSPLRISAAFLDFPETQGLRPPDPNEALSPLVAKSSALPFFIINGYQSSAFPSFGGFDPFPSIGAAFQETPIHFRPNPETREVDGTNWWFYSFSVEYQALEEGEFSFGPLSLKGAVAVDSKGGDSPELREVFVVAPAVSVRVTPPPEAGRPEWFSGAVGRSMAAKASLDTNKCKVGDPLILTLDISGDVNAASIRPPVLSRQGDMPDCFRFYDDHVESESIQGGKRFRYRLRPLKQGTLELPPVRTAFFNSASGEYATVLTDPIPLQVEATTQILVAGADDGDAAGTVVPDAIIWKSSDDFAIRGLPLVGAIDAGWLLAADWPLWLILPPALWLFVVGARMTARAVRSRREATRYARAARRARRRFDRIAASGQLSADKVAEAVAAARAFAAAILGEDSPSLTADEMRGRFAARGFPHGDSEAFVKAFAALEGAAFSNGGAGNSDIAEMIGELRFQISNLKFAISDLRFEISDSRFKIPPSRLSWAGAPIMVAALVLAAVSFQLCVATVASSLFNPRSRNFPQRVPDQFEWERAQNALGNAREQADYAAAARLYAGLAEDGADTGPLYHNMGVAFLKSGEPRLAAIALNRAATWRGATPEVRNNRILAEEANSGGAALPPSFLVFCWHYMLHAKWRIAIAVSAWCLAWLLAVLATSPRLRRAWAGAAAALLVSAMFAGSVAATCARGAERLLAQPQDVGEAQPPEGAPAQEKGDMP